MTCLTQPFFCDRPPFLLHLPGPLCTHPVILLPNLMPVLTHMVPYLPYVHMRPLLSCFTCHCPDAVWHYGRRGP